MKRSVTLVAFALSATAVALVTVLAVGSGDDGAVGVSAAQVGPAPTDTAVAPTLAVLPENPTAEDFLESDWVRVVDQHGDERGVMNVAVIGTEANTWEIDLGDGFVGTAVYAPDTLEPVGVFVSGRVGFAEFSEIAIAGRLRELDGCYASKANRDVRSGPDLSERCGDLLADRGVQLSDLAEG